MAAPGVVGVVAVLAVVALPLFGLRSAVSPADALPAGNPVRVAADAAGAGFAPGILSPTELIVSAPGVTDRPDALSRLGAGVRGQAGWTSSSARPPGATAIGHLRELKDLLPQLLAAAGLGGAEVALAGDTTVGLSLVDQANADLGRVALAVRPADLALLVLFLRTLVAPLYLLVSSVLAVGATLGLTTLLFQGLLHR